MHKAAAVILAGGRSSRFGSDKALLQVGGEALLARLCRQLLPQFEGVAIVAKTPGAYASVVPLAVARVPDLEGETNPLVGIEAGLSWSTWGAVFVLACDMPFGATPEVISCLATALEPNLPAVAFTWRGRPEPFCAFYRREPCLSVAHRLIASNRGPSQLLAEVGGRFVSYEEAFPTDRAGRPFLDIDAPEDLAALLKGQEPAHN